MSFFTPRERGELGKSAELRGQGRAREFVRNDFVPRERRPADPDISGHVGTLVNRVAASSVQEIDDLIVTLRQRREQLINESERVQRQIVEYATLSQSTMQATKIISESLAHFGKVPDAHGTRTSRVRDVPAAEQRSESAAEQRSESVAEQRGESVVEQRSESAAERRSEGVAEERSESAAEQRSEGIAEQLSEGIAELLSESVVEQRSEAAAEQRSEAVAERRSETVADKRSRKTAAKQRNGAGEPIAKLREDEGAPKDKAEGAADTAGRSSETT